MKKFAEILFWIFISCQVYIGIYYLYTNLNSNYHLTVTVDIFDACLQVLVLISVIGLALKKEWGYYLFLILGLEFLVAFSIAFWRYIGNLRFIDWLDLITLLGAMILVNCSRSVLVNPSSSFKTKDVLIIVGGAALVYGIERWVFWLAMPA
jgi:hypothetical protein